MNFRGVIAPVGHVVRRLQVHWVKARMVKMREQKRAVNLEPRSDAVGKILTFIRERRYQALERLPSEREFAEKFSTSRGAVREALAALEAMRVVERRPNSGIFLRNSDERSIEALVLHAESGLPFQAHEIDEAFE